jgi:hypothetical protein
MKPSSARTIRTLRRAWAVAFSAAAAAGAAWAAQPTVAPAVSDTPHARERATCLEGRSPQARATCLREVETARAENRQGALTTPDAAAVKRNRLARCAAHPPADRPACERLALVEGTASGSVEGGGVVRELRTRVEPAPAAPAATGQPAAPAASAAAR